ncbi:MAG: hypothetical protein QN178_14010 [Armatimonadota bacterium]|nr:hypothetical protein [Armatimonadota bacterium]
MPIDRDVARCAHCGEPLPPPAPKGRVPRRFCRDLCRVRYHAARRHEALEQVAASLQHAAEALRQVRRRS